VAGLAVAACVHLDLASAYAEAGGVINEALLFSADAVAAMLATLVSFVLAGKAAKAADPPGRSAEPNR
jgi:hypothetical protein